MSRQPIRSVAGARDGATAVEFALVVGPLLLLIFGVIEFGRALWTLNALQETASAGARCMGVLNTSCAASGAYSASSATSYIEQVASGWGIGLTASNISLNNAATCAGVSGFSQTTITYTFNTPIPMITPLVGDPFKVTACFPNQG
ncbi:MAG: pilus assembly protein [Caulobacteraceae bacterium]|nr:pilus assembly protein [Caulobacteraceae bacterium]